MWFPEHSKLYGITAALQQAAVSSHAYGDILNPTVGNDSGMTKSILQGTCIGYGLPSIMTGRFNSLDQRSGV